MPKNNQNPLFRNYYYNNKIFKIIGETKHHPPANKQWDQSIYSFNKNNLKLLPAKDNLVNKIMKSYFYLHNNERLARSRRMRSFKIKNSTKNLFLSKAEIKQTNDKAIITVYVYNREKEYFLRKIFFLSKNLIKKVLVRNKINDRMYGKKTIHKIKSSNILKKKVFTSYNNAKKPYSFLKLGNQMRILTLAFKTFAHMNKFNLLRRKFFFHFLQYIFSLLELSIKLSKLPENKGRKNKVKLVIFNKTSIISLDEWTYIDQVRMFKQVNNKLLHSIKYIDSNHNFFDKNKTNLSVLFTEYYNKNYYKFINKSLNHDIILSNFYMKLLINSFKFDKFLPGIKNLISTIYNKKIELNMVNLKYHHLNSDIFVESLLIKLRKRLSLLTALKSSLTLVKTPDRFFFKKNNYNLNKFHDLSMYKSLDIPNIHRKLNNKDILDQTIKNIYPYILSHDLTKDNLLKNEIRNKINKTNKTMDVLDFIKYKWVTGIRLETKGRLTRRFTASRSIFKLNIKGNLNNIDYSKKTDNINTNVSNVIVRNHINSNLQYTFYRSKRRIGAFGVKGWISSY